MTPTNRASRRREDASVFSGRHRPGVAALCVGLEGKHAEAFYISFGRDRCDWVLLHSRRSGTVQHLRGPSGRDEISGSPRLGRLQAANHHLCRGAAEAVSEHLSVPVEQPLAVEAPAALHLRSMYSRREGVDLAATHGQPAGSRQGRDCLSVGNRTPLPRPA